MKIVRLHSENVKRLSAVDITPEGTLVTVGGRNGAGKSSVLDSIAYALGGNALVPSQPIRQGESEAKIEVDLGDLKVTRRFRRTPIDVSLPGQPPGTKMDWGPTDSTLVVTNKEGARYPTPQAMLDKLLGKLTFDPLAFANMEPKEQREMLRRLVGLDFTALDQRRGATFNERTLVNREVKQLEAQLAAMPEHAGVPSEPVDVSALSAELERIGSLDRASGKALLERQAAQASVVLASERHNEAKREVDRILALLEKANEKLQLCREEGERAAQQLKLAEANYAEAAKALMDPNPVRQQIKDAEATNSKIRANAARAHFANQLLAKKGASLQLTEQLRYIENEKVAMLEKVVFPVPGLGMTDEGVTLNGVPMEQASASERLKVSVAVGLAVNPQLRVLLIRNGNVLDDDSLKQLAEQAAAADAQVWMEYVTMSPDGVSVMIEDGHVA